MIELEQLINKYSDNVENNLFVNYKTISQNYGDLGNRLLHFQSKYPSLQAKRILIMLPDSIEAVMVHLECFLQGGILIPLSPFIAPAQLAYICAKVKPNMIFTNESIYKKNTNIFSSFPCIITNKNPSVSFSLLNFSKEPIHAENEMVSNQGNEISTIFFTSGTTGIPKGICLTKNNILNAASINTKIFKLDPERTSLVTVPLYDYYGMIQIFSHVIAGAGFVIGESAVFPNSAFKKVMELPITDLVLVPYTLRKLLDFTASKGVDAILDSWKKVKVIASSSDLLSEELLDRAFILNKYLKFINVYGLTEAGRATFREIFHNSKSSSSIGKPSPGVSVHIDKTDGNTGEIIIKGTTVAKGYLKEVVNNTIQLSRVDKIRTGDLGYKSSGGEIFLIGRMDHIFNLRGMKLHPSEIEDSVLNIPHITDALAWTYTDEMGETNIALDVVSNGNKVDEIQIKTYLQNKIPRIFLPTKVRFIQEIKRTEIGNKAIRSPIRGASYDH